MAEQETGDNRAAATADGVYDARTLGLPKMPGDPRGLSTNLHEFARI